MQRLLNYLFVVALFGLGLMNSSFSSEGISFDGGKPGATSVLLSWCGSINIEKKAYCQGYIDGTMHNWKVSTACQSSRDGDQSFCAGSIAARDKVQRFYQSCQDCSYDSFRPDLADSTSRTDLFIKRMQEFRRDLAEVIGNCSPDNPANKYYCMGYNLQVEIAFADPLFENEPEFFEDKRTRGLGDGASDFMLHLWSSEVVHVLRPCIKIDTEARDLIGVVNEFASDNPELLRIETPTIFLTKALFYGVCPGPAKNLLPHREHCTAWDYMGGEFGSNNTCNKPVYVQFQAFGHPAIERQVNSGERFSTGLSQTQLKSGWWMFTICPSGYVSSVPFSEDNLKAITGSRYHCIKG